MGLVSDSIYFLTKKIKQGLNQALLKKAFVLFLCTLPLNLTLLGQGLQTKQDTVNDQLIQIKIDTTDHVLEIRYIPVGQDRRGVGVLTGAGMHGAYEIPTSAALFSKDVVVAGDFPHAIKLPNSNISFTVGAFAMGNFFMDYNPLLLDRFITAAIPTPPVKGIRTRATGKWSRVWFRAAFPTKSLGDGYAYIEYDFFGGLPGNPISAAPIGRLRQGWAEFLGIRIGLDYSNFTDLAIWPLIFEIEGPSALAGLRHGYVRKKFYLKNGVLSISAETSFSDLFFQEGYIPYEPSPDYVISYFYPCSWGHIRGAFLSRILGAQNSTATDDYNLAYGWGATLTGKVKTKGYSYFAWSLTGGNGIGRYILDGLVTENIGGFQDAQNSINPIPAFGLWANYTHFWNEHLYSTALGGYVRYYPFSEMGGTIFQSSTQGILNLIWMPAPSLAAGIEVNYGRRVNLDGEAGISFRWNVGCQFTF